MLRRSWRAVHRHRQCRRHASTPPPSSASPRTRINYNPEIVFDDRPDADLAALPLVTAFDLATSGAPTPPKGVRMLARDFIDDALYNPEYGYFSKRAVIFDAGSDHGFPFPKMKNQLDFDRAVAQRYAQYGHDALSGPGKQIWHTPTELFQPWYGQAIAQCLVSDYLLKCFPYDDFIVYELGAGNGTLARNVLDYLQSAYPDVYERTRYRIIEISAALAQKQRAALAAHGARVEVVNKSIFEWEAREWAPCFVVALEVADNFPHDVLRYHADTHEPYQTLIAVDTEGDFHELFTRRLDPLATRYLALRAQTGRAPPFVSSRLWRLRCALPFAPNLSPSHFIPTRLLDLLTRLRASFPRHRLLLSDFSSLPNAIPGHDAPVVQTRYRGAMIPVSTYAVSQGYFDIFFPTDFELLRDMYELVLRAPPAGPARASPLAGTATSAELGSEFFFSRGRRAPVDGGVSASGLPVGARRSGVYTHREFLETYAQLDKTALHNGENPMLDFYQNAKFLF